MRLVPAAICRADGKTMARRYNGRLYVAQGAYSEKEEAEAYASICRGEGSLARVTQERKPRRMRTSKRYMWVVWACPAETGTDALAEEEVEVACP
ncbi:MAG TPA: hypothetical protein PLA39_03020 [Methanoculleus sp.]|nr:hypothetical protein [Methanoculleus sp.]